MADILLHETQVSLASLPSDVTVLDFLREQRYKRGSKEGCASGDCGACTVVVVDNDPLDHSRLRYRSINACITFVKSIQGKQLITVEDLEDNGQLHPVQQAMVDLHGSQCGFCTPGFIMSMFALYRNIDSGAESRPADGDWVPAIERYLAGNLCRCTGYRPIVDATLHAIAQLDSFASARQPADQFARREPQVKAELVDLFPPGASEQQQFFVPVSLEELDELLASHPDTVILAGGTDLALEVTQRQQSLPKIICLENLTALRAIEIENDHCLLGAGASLMSCLHALASLLPELETLLHRFGSTQIRNQGTVGGNIANASPIGDLPPVLLSLGATVLLRSKRGERELPLADFFVSYKSTVMQEDEYIRWIRIPDLSSFRGKRPEARLKIYKISKRLDDDISAVCMSGKITCENNIITNACVAFGGMAAIPARAYALESELIGFDVAVAWSNSVQARMQSAISNDFQPISDARASAEYRLLVSANLIQRLMLELRGDVLTQVAHYV